MCSHSPGRPLRIALCQTVLPQYRVPVFNLLGAQPGVELTVFADQRMGSLESGTGRRSFCLEHAPVRHLRILGQNFRTQAAQFKAMDPRRFDLAILPWETRYLSLPAALLLARLRNLPVALWGHGCSKRPGRLRDALRNFCGQRADAVLLYTHSVARRLVDQAGFAPERVFVAQNALDQQAILAAQEHWLARPAELKAFAQGHGLDPQRTLIFVSRLEVEKRVGLLLQAMVRICAREPGARLVVVGEGPQRRALEDQAASLGLEGRVLFAGKIYDETALAPWMLCASLLCYPANLGLSLLHAFGYGLPVVTGDDLPGHGPEIEALAPGVNGLLYQRGNVDHMAEQCLNILSDATLRQTLSQGARRTVAEEYTLER
ncbi:MAG: glycosyltransferase family 4 protein, partial [Humidesulfovibrio sp.]|nr:glycosyltransferase family 4 protein [Humidesulfovibrio sp.]